MLAHHIPPLSSPWGGASTHALAVRLGPLAGSSMHLSARAMSSMSYSVGRRPISTRRRQHLPVFASTPIRAAPLVGGHPWGAPANRLLSAAISAARPFSTTPVPSVPGAMNKEISDTSVEGAVHRNVKHETEGGEKEEDNKVKQVEGDWVLSHPVYTPAELQSVKVAHIEAKTLSDKVAILFVHILRIGFDVATRYKHNDNLPPLIKKDGAIYKALEEGKSPGSAAAAAATKQATAGGDATQKPMTLEEMRKEGLVMDEWQWLRRCIFLESIAGVPGMVAAMLRHLRSMRLMRRDGGWIHTLLEESENERMHLLTFLQLRHPGWFFRAMVIGAQGVFFNVFFLCYLISPRTCHRFVGVLEEEAVVTYTRLIEEMEEGRLPEWVGHPAPDIAKRYWRLNTDATLLDTIYAIRADEATHRFVNHSLASLDQKSDFNPFAIRDPPAEMRGEKWGLTKEEAAQWSEEAAAIAEKGASRDKD